MSFVASIRSKFREYGEVVICADGNDYWRKEIFPYYKARRKESKEASDIPWAAINAVMAIVLEEMREYSPYKVLMHPRAEADDFMAVLTKLCLSREVPCGLDIDSEPMVMVSCDGDMKQLHTRANIKQYDPMRDRFIRPETTAREFIRRKILTGDSKDGVPGVFSKNDCLALRVRQTPCTEKKMLPILESIDLVSGTHDTFVKQRIEENMKLLSFEYIPTWLSSEIMDMYDDPPHGDKMKFYKYLISKKCYKLADEIDRF